MHIFKKISVFILLFIVSLVSFFRCNKQSTTPENPYDSINYGDSVFVEDTLDPNSITALHRDIFFPKCATPGCHDGNFEPNFLSVQSTYSTLVYHPLVKTDSNGYFLYRVQAYDTASSWLHERLVTDDATLGRMPLYADPLSQEEMDRINNWIMNGAPDTYENKAVYPDVQPTIAFYLALNEFTQGAITISGSDNRLNGIGYNPFLVKTDSSFYILVNVTDDSTAINALNGSKVLLSKKREDFSNATGSASAYLNSGGYEYWYSYISTASYSPGDTVYLRFYANDGKHDEDMEYPTDDDEFFMHLYWSFYVEN
jgi:hypothetical protein